MLALAAITPGLAASPPTPLRAAGTQKPDSSAELKPDAESNGATESDASLAPMDDSDAVTSSDPTEHLPLGMWSSVRTRGLESPVDLRPDPKPEAEPADVLDGTPRSRQESENQKTPSKKKKSPLSAREERVWPLPKGGFVFTQAFGCVPQLGNLYFPGAGCPPDRPVVHTGIDLAAPEGTVFYAAASGWVTLAGYDRPTPDANTRIIIQHDGRQEGYSTEYLHWVASYVAVGDYVRAGEPIGEVGNVGYSTGPHLHFSVIDLSTGEHIDPVRWLPPDNNSGAYKGRLPNAEFRLPPGTTAGQPEEADQNPPPAPRKEKVPKSPSASEETGSRAKNDHRGKAAADDQTDSGSFNHGAKRKHSKTGGAATSGTSNSDKTRERKRDKGGKGSERAESGEDGKRKHKDTSSDSGDETSDSGRGGHRDEGATDPNQGSRHAHGGGHRGDGKAGGNHDRGDGGNSGGRRDGNNHDRSNGGRNNGSSKRGDNGQNKRGDARKKDEVSVDTAAGQPVDGSSNDAQPGSDETHKGAKDDQPREAIES